MFIFSVDIFDPVRRALGVIGAASLITVSISAHSAVVETPYDTFSLENSSVKVSNISIVIVKNLEETCRKLESKNSHRTVSKFVEACSTWSFASGQSNCTIYTAKIIDFWILGHEVRHCFQGNFHD